jgi:hypothetical protein
VGAVAAGGLRFRFDSQLLPACLLACCDCERKKRKHAAATLAEEEKSSCLVPGFFPNSSIQKQDSPSYQNVGKYMEY